MSSEDDRITGKNQSLYAEPLDEVFTPYLKEWLKNWFERFTLEHITVPGGIKLCSPGTFLVANYLIINDGSFQVNFTKPISATLRCIN